MSLGLYQGRKLDAAADVGYQHLLDHALMPRVVRRLEERLRAVNKDNLEQAYEALKNYLMIYTPDKFDADRSRRTSALDWDAALERTLAPEQRQALDQHLDAMLTHGAPPPAVPMDKNLVAGVRDMLVAFPLEYRVFSRLKRAQHRRRHPAVHAWPARPARSRSACSSAPAASRSPRASRASSPRRATARRSRPRSTRRPASSPPRKRWVLGLRPTGRRSKSLPSARRTRS